ncbi:hypothetical protein FRC07_009960 [Ceratobasidium sp. 392]|nr:hypothetical protein FRC07_009960 [Ceratobasidium sp. 392]
MPSRARIIDKSSVRGVLTNKDFARYNFGVVDYEHPVLCCLECDAPPYVLLTASNCAAHYWAHRKGLINRDSDEEKDIDDDIVPQGLKHAVRLPTNRQIAAVVEKYDIWTGALRDVPTPAEPSPRLYFLEPHEAYRCTLCEAVGLKFIGRSPEARRKHFLDNHETSADMSKHERAITVQTFDNRRTERNNFEISMALSIAQARQDEPGPRVNPQQLTNAWIKQAKPLAPESYSGPVTVKVAHPYVGAFLARFANVGSVRKLAHGPYSTKEKLLHEEALQVFASDHAGLTKIMRNLRVRVVMDGIEQSPDPLEATTEASTCARYAECWAGLIIFVLRVRRLQTNNKCPLPVTFTKKQAQWADAGLDYCFGKESCKPIYILYELSRHLWWDQSTKFAHMLGDSFNDLTTAYSVFYTLREDLTIPLCLNVTHDLNALRFSMRQVFLYWAIQYQQRNGKSPTWYGSFLKYAPTGLPLITWCRVEDTLKQELDRTRTGPFSNVCDAISLAFEINSASEVMPDVVYQGEGDTALVTVRGKTIVMGEWKRAVQKLVAGLESFIAKKLLFGIDPKTIGFDFGPEKKIFDDHARTTPDYCYLTDDRNPFKDWRFNLASALFSNPKASGLFADALDEQGNVKLKEAGIDNWLNDYAYATRHLGLTIHFVSGQPSRGVEFSLVRLLNCGYRVRNIYYMGYGRMAIVLFYTKTSAVMGKDRVVAHCVPWRITRIMIIMDALIRPFACQVLDDICGPEERRVQEVFEFALRGRPSSSPIISSDLRSFFESNLDVTIGLRDHRHLAIVVMKHEIAEYIGPSERAVSALDLQAGHGSAVASKFYGVEKKNAYKIDSELLSAFFICSASWYKLMMGSDDLTKEDLNDLDTHASRVADKALKKIHAGPMPPPGVTKREVTEIISQYQEQAQKHLEKTTVESLAAIKTYLQTAERRTQEPAVAVTQLHLNALARYLNTASAEWTSPAQARAFARVWECKQSVLAVLRTGGGKSLLFRVPAMFEEGLTVVISPLHAVIVDQVPAAWDRNIPAIEWSPDNQDAIDKGLVFVIVDLAVQIPFQTWIMRVKANKQLNRIVFDEAHEILISQNYRECLAGLRFLGELGVPLLLLTATLPPELESELRDSVGTPTLAVERESTQRPNLVYRTAKFPTVDVATKSLIRHAEVYRQQLLPTEGILIICRSKAKAEYVASELKALCYHSGMSNEDRDKNATAWLQAQSQVIVTTPGFGVGVHHPHCRGVLHLGVSYSLQGYIQESSRAGRDGLPALAAIFHYLPRDFPPSGQDAVRLNAWEAMLDVAEGVHCQRLCMSGTVDGLPLRRTCASGNLLRCQPCNDEYQAVSVLPTRLFSSFDWASIHKGGFHNPHVLIEAALPRPEGWKLPSFEPRQGKSSSAASSSTHQVTSIPSESVQKSTAAIPASLPSVAAGTSLGANKGKGRATEVDDTALEPIEGQPETLESTFRTPRASEKQAPRNQAPLHFRGPPAHMGIAIQADAVAARAARLSRASNPARSSMGKIDLTPLVPDFVAVQTWLAGRCSYCVLYQDSLSDTFGHNVGAGCEASDWRLSGHPADNGVTYDQVKAKLQIPPNAGLCFMCIWPTFLHDGKQNMVNCQKDQVGQICWLVYTNEQWRSDLFMLMRPNTPITNATQYMTWLVGVADTVQTQGGHGKFAFLNAYRVIIWAIKSLKNHQLDDN